MEALMEIYGWFIGSLEMLVGFYFFTNLLNLQRRGIFSIGFFITGTVVLFAFPAESELEFPAYVGLLLVWGFFLCKDRAAVILYAVVTAELLQLGFGIVNSTLSLLSPYLLRTSPEITGICLMIFGDMLALLIAFFCYRILLHYTVINQEEVQEATQKEAQKRYRVLLLAPVLLLLFVSGYIGSVIYGNTVEVVEWADSSQRTKESLRDIGMFVIQLLGLASLFCVMYAQRKLEEGLFAASKVALLEQETQFQKAYITEAKLRYEKTKRFRHDIKNHILVTKELLEQQKIAESRQYLGELEELTEELSFPYHTGHPVVDVLIGNKLGLAKSEGIEVDCSLTLPYPCTIRDTDLCIILANALDNAIHGCNQAGNSAGNCIGNYDYVDNCAGEAGFIRVSGAVQGNFILIRVENSFDGRAVTEGTGLSNIRRAAERYQGVVKTEQRGRVFSLDVLLVQE